MKKTIMMSISNDYMRGDCKLDITDMYNEWESDDRDIDLFMDSNVEELQRMAIDEIQFEWTVFEDYEEEEEEYED